MSLPRQAVESLRSAIAGDVFLQGQGGFRRLQEIRAKCDPEQAIISVHPAWPSQAQA